MTHPSAARLQGDEQELFNRFRWPLRRITRAAVNTSPDIVDDACAFTWMKLLTNQPRRETVYAWLRAVARNEAVRLDRLARGETSLSLDDRTERDPPEPRSHYDPIATTHGLLELRERLEQLPQRQREIVFLAAAGWRYQDLADREGISHTRVTQIIATAAARMREMDIREHEARSPRAARLRELEDAPPRYLTAAIGKPPRMTRKQGVEELRREWRRLAVAIDDFRTSNRITDQVIALGTDRTTPDRDALAQRIHQFRHQRGLTRGLER